MVHVTIVGYPSGFGAWWEWCTTPTWSQTRDIVHWYTWRNVASCWGWWPSSLEAFKADGSVEGFVSWNLPWFPYQRFLAPSKQVVGWPWGFLVEPSTVARLKEPVFFISVLSWCLNPWNHKRPQGMWMVCIKLLAILLIFWLKYMATIRTVTWSTQNGENQWNTWNAWNTSNLLYVWDIIRSFKSDPSRHFEPMISLSCSWPKWEIRSEIGTLHKRLFKILVT